MAKTNSITYRLHSFIYGGAKCGAWGFRNNILHNGVVMYSDEDIDVAYELLLGLIEILITVEEQLQEQYCVDEM